MNYLNQIADSEHLFNPAFIWAMWSNYRNQPDMLWADGFAQMYLGCFFE